MSATVDGSTFVNVLAGLRGSRFHRNIEDQAEMVERMSDGRGIAAGHPSRIPSIGSSHFFCCLVQRLFDLIEILSADQFFSYKVFCRSGVGLGLLEVGSESRTRL